jgi:hypothetical protein
MQTHAPSQVSSDRSASSPDLTLQRFMNPYRNSSGWYAPGHHDIAQFRAAVARSTSRGAIETVRQTWISVHQGVFEEVNATAPAAQPITLIEILLPED